MSCHQRTCSVYPARMYRLSELSEAQCDSVIRFHTVQNGSTVALHRGSSGRAINVPSVENYWFPYSAVHLSCSLDHAHASLDLRDQRLPKPQTYTPTALKRATTPKPRQSEETTATVTSATRALRLGRLLMDDSRREGGKGGQRWSSSMQDNYASRRAWKA